jgi:hypothetical protein
MLGLTVTGFQRQVTVLKSSGKTGHRSDFLRFRGIRCMKVSEVCLWILQLTFSIFQCLLIHMVLVTTVMVMAIERHPSCGV